MTLSQYAGRITQIIDADYCPDFTYPDCFDADVESCFQRRMSTEDAAAKLFAEWQEATAQTE